MEVVSGSFLGWRWVELFSGRTHRRIVADPFDCLFPSAAGVMAVPRRKIADTTSASVLRSGAWLFQPLRLGSEEAIFLLLCILTHGDVGCGGGSDGLVMAVAVGAWHKHGRPQHWSRGVA